MTTDAVRNRNRYWNVDVLGVLRGRYYSPVFAIKIGETAIRNCFRDQLIAMRDEGIANIGNIAWAGIFGLRSDVIH